jgi:thiol-disulfide isomerase/thioredoxin
MMMHPSFKRLRAFATGELSGRRRWAVARHLERCERCRAEIRWVRETVDQTSGRAVAPAGALEPILARVRAGDRVLLPAGSRAVRPASFRTARGVRVAAAATVVALVGAGALLLMAPEAWAEKSDLWLSPAAPTAGEEVQVSYRSTSRLAGEDRLILRARYRVDDDATAARTVTVGELTPRRGGDRYEGTLRLPDDAVYAVLAVEDARARYVDDNGEQWEILVHGADERPLYGALRRRIDDLRMRNTLLAEQTVEELARLYPDRVEPWYLLHGQESRRTPEESRDSLRAEFGAHFERVERRVVDEAGFEPDDLWMLSMLARSLGRTEARDRWQAELIERHPRSPGAIQQEVFRASSEVGGGAALLAVLDSLWRRAPGVSVQVMMDGFRMAQQSGDPELVQRWYERIASARPGWGGGLASSLLAWPETRDAGMDRLRAELAAIDATDGERPLTRTADEHAADRRRTAGRYLGQLGSALLDSGRYAAALDTLNRALDTGWDPQLFRTTGAARLAAGDSLGAGRVFARLAADPLTGAEAADSLRGLLSERTLQELDWDRAVRDGRAELRGAIIAQSVNRAPLRDRVRIQELGGGEQTVRVDGGVVTVAAFWSRYCPPSMADLAAFGRVANVLEARGVRVLAISDETNPHAVGAFLAERGLGFPTFLDPHREARIAFDNRGTPNYVVVDAEGRIRFSGHRAEDILRQVAALEGD